jgi:uncharacterized protein YccT (UPF0319 family)
MHDQARGDCQDDLTEYNAGVSAAQASIAKFAGMSAFDEQSLEARKTELTNKQRELGDREAMAEQMADER